MQTWTSTENLEDVIKDFFFYLFHMYHCDLFKKKSYGKQIFRGCGLQEMN